MHVVVGLSVFVAFSLVLYGGARLAPERTEAELAQIREERGDRVAVRFRQMEQQRRFILAIGRVVLPSALAALIVALVVQVF